MRKNRAWMILCILVAAAIVLVLIGLFQRYTRISEPNSTQQTQEFSSSDAQPQIQGTIVLAGEKIAYTDKVKTFLFIGTDNSGDEQATGKDYQGSMADFLVLVVIDETAQKYGFLQINRNTIAEVKMIDHNGQGEAVAQEQICTAHWYGGNKKMSCRNTVDAISQLLGGIKIEGYFALGLNDIAELNHAIGGVTVTIEDDFSKLDKSLVEGETIHLTDKQAVHYLQGRINVGKGDNTSRMRRQQTYMEAFFKKISKSSHEDEEIIDTYDKISDVAVTNFDSDDLALLADAIQNYESLGFFTPDGKTKKGFILGDGILHEEFRMNKKDALFLLKQLYGLEG